MARRQGKTATASGNDRGKRSRDVIIAGIGLVGALLGAGIGLVATMLATSSANGDQISLQVRAMKQAQYAATYKAVDLEIQSMHDALAALQSGNASLAMKEVKSYRGRDQVVEQLAVLPLVADARVLSAGLDYLNNREKMVADLLSVGQAFDANQSGRQTKVAFAENQLLVLRRSEGNLLVAMRLDLNLPPS